MARKMTLQAQVKAHIKLAQERVQLLANIPDFQDFLQPLEHLPTVGPIVVINIHKTWYNIPLPDFREQADALRIAASHGVRIWIRYA